MALPATDLGQSFVASCLEPQDFPQTNIFDDTYFSSPNDSSSIETREGDGHLSPSPSEHLMNLDVCVEPPLKKQRNGVLRATRINPPDINDSALRELLHEKQVKRMRLARKAELARLSRRRKKMRMEELEGQVASLKQQLEEAQKKVQDSEKRMEEMRERVAEEAQGSSGVVAEMKRLNGAMKACLDNPNKEEAKKLVDSVVSTFQRRVDRVVDFAKSTKELVCPVVPLQFVDWVMTRNPKFYDDPNGLWNSLFSKELNLTPEQLNSVKELRKKVQTKMSQEKVEEVVETLTSQLKEHVVSSTVSMLDLVGVLTPEQLMKFFLWVETYGPVCIKINV